MALDLGSSPRTLLDHDGLVEYIPNFLNRPLGSDFFTKLKNEIIWQQDQLVIFGREVTTKRRVSWYGSEAYCYIYSNAEKVARPWTPSLISLKNKLEFLTQESYNACLLNFYDDGSQGMGWHSDDESMMTANATIASISLGAERKFNFRHKKTQETVSILLEHGSLLLMKGEVQTYWKHNLPVSKKVWEPRINLTFRQVDPSKTRIANLQE